MSNIGVLMKFDFLRAAMAIVNKSNEWSFKFLRDATRASELKLHSNSDGGENRLRTKKLVVHERNQKHRICGGRSAMNSRIFLEIDFLFLLIARCLNLNARVIVFECSGLFLFTVMELDGSISSLSQTAFSLKSIVSLCSLVEKTPHSLT